MAARAVCNTTSHCGWATYFLGPRLVGNPLPIPLLFPALLSYNLRCESCANVEAQKAIQLLRQQSLSAGDYSLLPHSEQNFMPFSTDAPHLGHLGCMIWPSKLPRTPVSFFVLESDPINFWNSIPATSSRI